MPDTQRLDPLDKLVAALDWTRCLQSITVSKKDVTEIADLFNRSSRLVYRYPNKALEEKRKRFISSLAAALEAAGAKDRVQELIVRLDEARLFEKCFEAILSTLPKTASGKLPPDRHAWAIVERLSRQQAQVEKDLLRALRTRKEVFDPLSMLVEDQYGESEYAPDAILSRLSGITASSIVMLAIQNQWIKDKRFVVLPKRPDTSDQDVYAVGITEYLGNAWEVLEYLEKRWRFFGGQVSLGEITVVSADATSKQAECVAFVPGYTLFELADHIATERLNRYVLQNLADLAFAGSVEKRLAGSQRPVASAPGQYVSSDEAYSAVALSSLLHFNVLADPNTYGGLRFSEWIRGYSWLQERSTRVPGALHEVSAETALQELGDLSIGREAATTLLSQLSLNISGGDLFDTPLIRCEGERFVYHAGLLRALNIPRVILSRLSSLLVQIAPKGESFEDSVLALFAKRGLSAKRFKFSRDGEEYQYDAAMVWDDLLFVIEDKSYSLPLNDPMRLYWFAEKMSDAVEQVHRLARAADRYPDEIRSKLGLSAEYQWKAVIPCVLNSLPWSIGKVDDAFILDYSSVGRFLESRTLYVKSPVQLKNVRLLWRHHLKEFWPKSGPTAQDFLREMETPWQLRSLATTFAAERGQLQLSEGLALITGFLRRKPADSKEMLEAAGVSDPAPELEAIHAEIDKLRTKVEESMRGKRLNKRGTPKKSKKKKVKKKGHRHQR